MTKLWNRIVKVTVAGKGGSATFDGRQFPQAGLKIGFDVTKTIGSSQNTGTVTVTNLSKSRRNMLGEEYDTLELTVGYNDDGGSLLLKGNIRDVKHQKDSPDVVSTIEIGDGDKGVNEGAASKTFKAGTKPKEIVEYLVKQMPGVEIGQLKGLDDLAAYKRPVTLFGYAANELNELGRQHKFYWSIQNGKFEAVANDKFIDDGVILVSQETGLIGIAEPTDKGVKFKCLINTRLLPGRKVKVQSDFIDETSGREKRDSDDGGGLFRVSSAHFSGDSRDAPFFVEVDANRIQGEKVVK